VGISAHPPAVGDQETTNVFSVLIIDWRTTVWILARVTKRFYSSRMSPERNAAGATQSARILVAERSVDSLLASMLSN